MGYNYDLQADRPGLLCGWAEVGAVHRHLRQISPKPQKWYCPAAKNTFKAAKLLFTYFSLSYPHLQLQHLQVYIAAAMVVYGNRVRTPAATMALPPSG